MTLRRESYPFYFCQLEAIETLIWWVEGADEFKQGIAIPGDGGPWERLCNKMATGAGKTTVMAMIITWQALNALTYPKRTKDFSRAFLVRSAGPDGEGPPSGADAERRQLLRRIQSLPVRSPAPEAEPGRGLIENWHTLMPLDKPKRSVMKKGPESDEAFTRRVLGKLAGLQEYRRHQRRGPPRLPQASRTENQQEGRREQGIDLEEATRWIEGLDRIHKTRRILRCFDLSATPFAPTGKASTDTALFDWIISDFGLNDAIESGLVKTPRVVVRDDALPDAKTLRPKLYHIYRDASVSEDFNRKAEAHEPLPKLVQDAYTLLGADWRETLRNGRGIIRHPSC